MVRDRPAEVTDLLAGKQLAIVVVASIVVGVGALVVGAVSSSIGVGLALGIGVAALVLYGGINVASYRALRRRGNPVSRSALYALRISTRWLFDMFPG